MADKRILGKRQILTTISIGFLAISFACIGIFAYLHSEDTVTNRLAAHHPSVALAEPQWYAQGMKKAEASEPGMLIEKNPYAWNDGDIDIYVRIKMEISVTESQNKNLSDTAEGSEIGKLSAVEVRNKILCALTLNDGKTPLVTSIDNDGNIAINHSMFNCESAEQCDYAVEKVDDFTYYFYFVKNAVTDNLDSSELIILHPNENSAELFNYVNIPIYKKDYLGVFDQNYQIQLIAEAVPVESCQNNTVSEYKRVSAI